MAESTLTLTKADLRGQTAFFLGWGLDPAGWDDDQSDTLKFCVDSGCRRFFYPIQSNGQFYDWSFLRPVSTQILPSGASSINLPDDYGGIQGPITIQTADATTGQVWWPVRTRHEGDIRLLYATLPSATGRPTDAAEVPVKGTSGAAGQRFQLQVYPAADQDYTLQFAYTLLLDALSDQQPIPYGSALHSETILEACLSVAEERLDDEMKVHAAKFKELLNASMKQDQRHKPQLLGYNGDQSDDLWNRRGYRPLGQIQVGGVVY